MINHKKAYILGLFVGNGTIANDTFIIKLPFKKWGMAPTKMNAIARDILTKISDKFYRSYGFSINYEIGNKEWILKPIEKANILEIQKDLVSLGLPKEGFLLKQTSLSIAKKKLTGINVESFLSGIFDTRCSLTKSHRRFIDDAPIVSLEIPGSTENFIFVKDVCSWLADLGTVTDQILYNHPNQQASSDPHYKNWKKGFKIRFLVNSFLAKNSFVLKAKAIDIDKLKVIQKKKEQVLCIRRKISMPSPVCIHSDISSSSLPIEVRNKLFFHYHHYCAVLGCKHAPINEVKKIIDNYSDLIFVLPRLIKGNYSEIKTVLRNIVKKHLKGNRIISKSMSVQNAIKNKELKNYLEIERGIAFLFADKLHGKRPAGSKDEIITNNRDESIKIYSVKKTHLSPLVIVNANNKRAFLVSAIQSDLNQELIKKYISVKGLNVCVL